MEQKILVGILFLIALYFIGRLIYRQINAGKDKGAHCDKCISKQTSKKSS